MVTTSLKPYLSKSLTSGGCFSVAGLARSNVVEFLEASWSAMTANEGFGFSLSYLYYYQTALIIYCTTCS
jgi:hypothetical protein